MNFATGNSGNRLQAAVVKTGPGCQQEGVFCQYLGDNVAPRIYAILEDGYVMESLLDIGPSSRSDVLVRIEEKLEKYVWNRPAIPSGIDKPWREKLWENYGVRVPDWIQDKETCLVHGDPTVSNAMHRNGELVLIDPRPPRDYIPQTPETDMGRIVQSLLGWEGVAYGAPAVQYRPPRFMNSRYHYKAAMFWAGAAAARIEYLEMTRQKRTNILDWCGAIRRLTNV